MGQTADSALAHAFRQSVVAPQHVGMRPARAPYPPRPTPARPGCAARLALLIFATIGTLRAARIPPDTQQLKIVCQERMSQRCWVWQLAVGDVHLAEKKLHRVPPQYACGISNSKTSLDHKQILVYSPGNVVTVTTCKKIIHLPMDSLSDWSLDYQIGSRQRRQASYRGRFRGQTQSQYLAINQGSKDEGKAEAISAADTSKAVVSGRSGMGQAQSQSIYDPSCDECVDRYVPGAESLRRPTGGNDRHGGGNWDQGGGPVLKEDQVSKEEDLVVTVAGQGTTNQAHQVDQNGTISLGDRVLINLGYRVLISPGDRALINLGDWVVINQEDRVLISLEDRVLINLEDRVLISLGDRVLINPGDRVLISLGDRVLINPGDRVLINLGDRVLINLGDLVVTNLRHWVVINPGYRVLINLGDRVLINLGHRVLISPGDRALISPGDRALINPGDRVLINLGDWVVIYQEDRVLISLGDRVLINLEDRVLINLGNMVVTNLRHWVVINPGDRVLINLGYRVLINLGYRVQVNLGERVLINLGDRVVINLEDTVLINLGDRDGTINLADRAVINQADRALQDGTINRVDRALQDGTINLADRAVINRVDRALRDGTINLADRAVINQADRVLQDGTINLADRAVTNQADRVVINRVDRALQDGTINLAHRIVLDGTINLLDRAVINPGVRAVINQADRVLQGGTINQANRVVINRVDRVLGTINLVDRAVINRVDRVPDTSGNQSPPQNVIDPNSIAADGDDSQAESSITQNANGTMAMASSNGGNNKGRAKTQVSGTYAGSGTFQAQAEISDESKGAQSEVSGGKHGAISIAQGHSRNSKSQANVNLGSETGSLTSGAQSDGVMHSSNTQVQGGVKGGSAEAQARGPGSTSSQAQIGFTPFKDSDKANHDLFKTPFVGAGKASSHSNGRIGESQSQLEGTFKYGIKYTGAAQSGASLDKDAVFASRLPFNKIDVFDKSDVNINVDETERPPDETPLPLPDINDVQNNVLNITEKPQDQSRSRMASHSHLDHHMPDNENKAAPTSPPPAGNTRSFQPPYANNNDLDYTSDKEDNPTEDYDADGGFGPEGSDPVDGEDNYDDFEKDTETHQSLHSPSRKSFEIKQSTGGNTQHIVLGALHGQDAVITQRNNDPRPDESRIYQPGESVPGTGGYTIPVGFTGSIKSVASKQNTYAIGSRRSPSQAQTVSITPGNGKVKYVYPNPNVPPHRKYVAPKDLRSYSNNNKDDNNRYVSVSKTITGDLDGENNIRKQYSHTYYTKSSSCGYFTFTCTMVSGPSGRKKVCKPKMPTNPDGTPMRC
ncbi:uncharacterized protein LOC134661780 [Cydia amplana]|uniref:uncharacterized protein LOC134661780 n=1 Tax=Cydia amplana TaxID=1869771 RepID=UPI002FE689E9